MNNKESIFNNITNTLSFVDESNSQKSYCICENCGKEAVVDMSVVYTSNPPVYKYKCLHCGKTGYVGLEYLKCENHIYESSDMVRDLEIKIKELEKRLEKIENAKREDNK